MTEYYYVYVYNVHGREYRYIGCFVPAKSFARSNNQYFGGFIAKEFDQRPLEELKNEKNIIGLQVNEGGCGIMSIRGSDLYKSRQELWEIRDQVPIAEIMEMGEVIKLRSKSQSDLKRQCCVIL